MDHWVKMTVGTQTLEDTFFQKEEKIKERKHRKGGGV